MDNAIEVLSSPGLQRQERKDLIPATPQLFLNLIPSRFVNSSLMENALPLLRHSCIHSDTCVQTLTYDIGTCT